MKLAVLPGDGIGPEVIRQALKVLDALSQAGLAIEREEALIGGCAFDATGHPLPEQTLQLVTKADAILFGAQGGFQYESLPHGLRPGDALLAVGKQLDLYANYRPIVTFETLIDASPLKREFVANLDILLIRELTSDLYFGEPRGISTIDGVRVGVNTMRYDEKEIARVVHTAFRAARMRKRKLCSVDKANVLESTELWRTVVNEIAPSYPEVQLTHLYIEAAAMALLRNPRQFDVIVTGNLFGDILSDEASMLTGSLGMLPSASINGQGKGLFEPVHGCAPDIANQDIANPLGAVLAAAMMLRNGLSQPRAADWVEAAVRKVLADGLRTRDIAQPGTQVVGTEAMGDAVAAAVRQAVR